IPDASFETLGLAANGFAYDPTPSNASGSVAGGVTGYIQDVKQQRGKSGTPITLGQFNYFSHAGTGGVAVYPLAGDTVYGNTDGTDQRTTTLTYGWGSTDQPGTVTTHLPAIDAAHN